MGTIEYFEKKFDQLQSTDKNNQLSSIRQEAFSVLSKVGIPTARHEEWKYTRIGGLFNKEYQFPVVQVATQFSTEELKPLRLPGHENANEIVFVNGLFSSTLSSIRSKGLVLLPLEEAARNEYKDIVAKHFGHSGQYLTDGSTR
jgi:Fe-S cluster assembly protein SufD